jgi:hypothetical protein
MQELPIFASQEFTEFGSDGGCFDCQISSNSNTLTNVSRGAIRKGVKT